MNMNQDPRATGGSSAYELKPAWTIFAQMTKLLKAMARLIFGPQTSERERFRQNVAEARARRDWRGPG